MGRRGRSVTNVDTPTTGTGPSGRAAAQGDQVGEQGVVALSAQPGVGADAGIGDAAGAGTDATDRSGTAGAAAAAGVPGGAAPVEVSVVMPCLNEEQSVGLCVAAAVTGLAKAGLDGEVVVVDNGSIDDSVRVATAAGARVVAESRRGYGNAYRAGFAAARGRIIVMGDSDGSYDFGELGDLVAPLLAGDADYVLGSRFAGEILPGAMPPLHRYLGNPLLTWVLNRLFGLSSSDAHSGMRAFTAQARDRMVPRCEGMELASELVIAAGRAELRIAEIPIVYHPRLGDSKLHSLRDGWRHLRFMLMLAPRHLFVLPGLTMFVLGVAGQLALLPGALDVGFHALDAHFSVLFALIAILGWQVALLGLFAHAHNVAAGWGGRARWPVTVIERSFSLERGLLAGTALFATGLVIDLVVLTRWLENSLGPLNELRPALLAMTLMVIGAQTAFSSFLLRLISTGPSGGSSRAAAPVTATRPRDAV
jgi:hypothetical protein